MLKIMNIKSFTFSFVLFTLLINFPLHAEKVNSCIECHSIINEDVTNAFMDDVHHTAGLSCVDCHGGDANIDDEMAMDPKKGFVGIPKPQDEPAFCAKCHSNPAFMRSFNPSMPTDQADKYWTSKHGTLLKTGDGKVATCTDCHKAHGIQTAEMPTSSTYPLNVPATCGKCHADVAYMSTYGIPTHQYEQYKDSSNVHGYALYNKRDMSAPVCNDCHGNHGAAPPGVTHVSQVCSQCHSKNGELFRESPHKDAFDNLELAGCAFCHQANPDLNSPHQNIHTIVRPQHSLVGTDSKAVCIQCHAEGDNGWATAEIFRILGDTLIHRVHNSTKLLHELEKKGLEVSDAKWMLDGDIKHAMMELRTIVHSFNKEEFLAIHKNADSLVNEVVVAGVVAQKELSGRIWYFIVLTIVILMTVITLIFKIRDIDRQKGKR